MSIKKICTFILPFICFSLSSCEPATSTINQSIDEKTENDENISPSINSPTEYINSIKLNSTIVFCQSTIEYRKDYCVLYRDWITETRFGSFNNLRATDKITTSHLTLTVDLNKMLSHIQEVPTGISTNELIISYCENDDDIGPAFINQFNSENLPVFNKIDDNTYSAELFQTGHSYIFETNDKLVTKRAFDDSPSVQDSYGRFIEKSYFKTYEESIENLDFSSMVDLDDLSEKSIFDKTEECFKVWWSFNDQSKIAASENETDAVGEAEIYLKDGNFDHLFLTFFNDEDYLGISIAVKNIGSTEIEIVENYKECNHEDSEYYCEHYHKNNKWYQVTMCSKCHGMKTYSEINGDTGYCPNCSNDLLLYKDEKIESIILLRIYYNCATKVIKDVSFEYDTTYSMGRMHRFFDHCYFKLPNDNEYSSGTVLDDMYCNDSEYYAIEIDDTVYFAHTLDEVRVEHDYETGWQIEWYEINDIFRDPIMLGKDCIN